MNFREAIECLLAGGSIRSIVWRHDEHIKLNGKGELVDEDGNEIFDFAWDGGWKEVFPMSELNGIDVPTPFRGVMEAGEEYYSPDLINNKVNYYVWSDSTTDSFRLKSGLVHKNLENAKIHLKALVSIEL